MALRSEAATDGFGWLARGRPLWFGTKVTLSAPGDVAWRPRIVLECVLVRCALVCNGEQLFCRGILCAGPKTRADWTVMDGRTILGTPVRFIRAAMPVSRQRVVTMPAA